MMLIILHSHRPKNPLAGGSVDFFIAELPDGMRLRRTRGPIYDTARHLSEGGYSDDTTLEFQHYRSEHIAARGTIGDLRQWIVTEDDKTGLRRRRYVPFPLTGS